MHHQPQRVGHFAQRTLGVLAHHMHLDAAFPVMLVQALVVVLQVALPLFLRVDVDRHRPAHDRHAVVEHEHFLLMEVEQRVLERLLPVLGLDRGVELQVALQQLLKFAKGGVDEEVLAAGAGG